MANDAVLQVRMDSHLKHSVEQLYRDLGTSFPEAVRIFAQQSLLHAGLPFEPVARVSASTSQLSPRLRTARELPPDARSSGFGILSSYADEAKRYQEKNAWALAAERKHGETRSE